jgi:hypothetical protein
MAKCAASPAYFTDTYLIIDDSQDHGDGSGTMPFHLWPDQFAAMESLTLEQLVIFLKARQLGITWLCLAYALWLMAFHSGKVVYLFSQGKKQAGEMLRRIMVMYERLPTWMIARLPKRMRNNKSEQGWANGSCCTSMPATERSGRSFTASLAIMDEAAHLQWGKKLYAALKPTIDGGGKLFVVSSANGEDGFFDVLWKKAIKKAGKFKSIFLSWRSHPERDDAWYADQREESTDPELLKQEYPSTDIEAFISSGRVRFPGEWVDAQARNIGVPMEPGDLGYPKGLSQFEGLDIFSGKIGGRRYVIGADVAEGLEKKDYDAATLIDRETFSEHACLHGHWEPSEYARRLAALAEVYDADIVVERNNHGHAVLLKLLELCPDRVACGLDGRPGWVTSSTTKPQSVDLIAEHLRDRSITVRSQKTLHEMKTYRVIQNGVTSSPSDGFDDLVMAWAILVAWIRLVHASQRIRRGPNPTAGWRG